MTRLLLAFLALIGLAATTAPAQARLADRGAGTEIGLLQGAGTGSVAGNALPLPVIAGTGAATCRTDGARPRAAARPVYIPTIQFGPDRAYE